ncbi:MAG TPA: SemiSWEET family transporter [Paracoccus sp. (in: a-proteobacteria)]|uniref:SemiSWEET family sugar transporter n=1 Tax=uncultured Paracoccus sp. TaxID=189685 RepID=UPI002628A53F|nr:SemiSWEET family transporter [uncultured Paracoccus sp.]HMQ42497.1 SemiSWEET family transporter [Paracoccus sp. (in: a-proteobacteria)]HMR37575.1 SemiSWEET family transporter [Paracoccus sp. (in: a-proteobacteria)]
MLEGIAPYLGYAAAVLGTLCWVPQLARTFRTRMVRDISFWTTLLLLITVSLWLLYGLILGAWPIIVANVLSACAIAGLLIAKIIWEKP